MVEEGKKVYFVTEYIYKDEKDEEISFSTYVLVYI